MGEREGADRRSSVWGALRTWAARHGIVLLLYSALVIAATWPVVTELRTAIIGRESDAFVHLWLFHWIEDALRAGRFTFFTDRLFYPTGVSLLNQTVAWLNASLWILVKPFVGAIPAYSLLVMALMVFNGFATYRFAGDLTGSRAGAVVAGAVTLLWPSVLEHTYQISLLPIGFMVMALRSLRNLLDRGRSVDAVRLGLWLGLIGMLRFQTLILGAFLWGSYAVARLVRMDARMVWLRVRWGILAAGLGAILSLPFTLPYLIYHFEARAPGDLANSITNNYASDLVFYVLPRKGHLLLGALTRGVTENHNWMLSVHSPALGWVTLGLIAVAITVRWRQVRGWIGMAGWLLILALGPRPQVFGIGVKIQPYAWVVERYLLPMIREPDRFNLLLAIPLSLSAGWGVSGIVDRIQQFPLKLLSVLTLIGAVFVDYVALPHPRLSVAVPPWYASLSDDPEDYGLLEIPTYRQSNERYMLYQLTHGKALVYGHVSRVPADAYAFIESVPVLAYLHQTDGAHPPLGDFDLSRSLDRLREAGVPYVVIHKDEMSQGKVAQWRAWFPFPPSHEDARLLVYDTAWREALGAAGDARRFADGADVLGLTFGPESTVPGGWVEVEGVWHVAAGAAGRLAVTLSHREDGGGMPLPALDLRGAGSGNRDDLLVRRGYPMQIPQETAPGAYRLCLGPSPRAESLTDRDLGACYDLMVKARTRRFTPPPSEHVREVTFGERIKLVGFSSDLGETDLHLRLVWQAVREMVTSYKVFLHVVDARTGALAAQLDFVPQSWAYPTTYWRAGEYVEDEVALDLTDLSAGSYEVKVGLYDPAPGERLATDPPSPDDAVTLMTFAR